MLQRFEDCDACVIAWILARTSGVWKVVPTVGGSFIALVGATRLWTRRAVSTLLIPPGVPAGTAQPAGSPDSCA